MWLRRRLKVDPTPLAPIVVSTREPKKLALLRELAALEQRLIAHASWVGDCLEARARRTRLK
jgi:hypothetical protein